MGISKNLKIIFCFLLLPLIFPACSRNEGKTRGRETAVDKTKPVLALSILPQTWFAQRIAWDRVHLLVLAGPGQNPHSFEPTPSQMKDLSHAGAWVLSGTEFEIALLPKIRDIFPKLTIIDGTQGMKFRMLEADHDCADHDDHDHASAGVFPQEKLPNSKSAGKLILSNPTPDDSQTLNPEPRTLNTDRHTWLGHSQSKILASHIRDALVLIDPANEDFYNNNYTALIREIDVVFDTLRAELTPLAGSSIYVYHPAFGYFLDEFGIIQEAVELGGKEPGPRELNALVSEMTKKQVKVIFVQAQFPVNAAATVARAAGAELAIFDPLSSDWIVNIRDMGNALKKAAIRE